MTNELKDMLTSVIAEALQPIHTELKQLNSRVSNIEVGQKELVSRVGNLEAGQKELVSRVSNLEAGQKELVSRVGNLEAGQKELVSRVGNLEAGQKELVSRVGSIEGEVKNIKLQLDENTQLTRIIFDRQEETDARLENISLDIHKAHGDITAIKEQLTDIQGEVEFTYHKTSRNELELFKLRRAHA